jgi:xylulokinase
MWWRRNRPDIIENTWKFLCYGEFALLRLGVRPVIDEGLAARTMAYDLGLRTWSRELLDFAGIPIDKLAEVAPSGTILGTIAPDIAGRLLLPEGVSVVLGGHDQPMGALGAGIVAPGTALYAIGTTEALVAVAEGPLPALGHHNIPCYPHVLPGRHVALAGSQSGGRVLAWYREAIAPGEGATEAASFDNLLDSLSDVPPSWPILLPHFAGSGSVLNDHMSLAALFGMQFETSRNDILLAMLEGITFEQAIGLGALSDAAGPINELRAIGGGSRSAVWLQMKADILGRSITRVALADAPCLGAAILGRWAIERRSPIEDVAASMVQTAETVHPRPDRHAAHSARLEIYRALYAALQPLAPRLRALWQAPGAGLRD